MEGMWWEKDEEVARERERGAGCMVIRGERTRPWVKVWQR